MDKDATTAARRLPRWRNGCSKGESAVNMALVEGSPATGK